MTTPQDIIKRAQAFQAELDAAGSGRTIATSGVPDGFVPPSAALLPPVPPGPAPGSFVLAPRGEDSEAVEEPVFLWTFTCFGMTTKHAARIHIRVRARGMTQAERKVEALGFSIDKLVEVQELAPEHFVS